MLPKDGRGQLYEARLIVYARMVYCTLYIQKSDLIDGIPLLVEDYRSRLSAPVERLELMVGYVNHVKKKPRENQSILRSVHNASFSIGITMYLNDNGVQKAI